MPSTNQQNFTVTGAVYFANGKPGAAITVVVFNKNLRNETEIGRATTDRDGAFIVSYAPVFTRFEYKTADIVLRLNTATGQEITAFSLFVVKGGSRMEIGEPRILFNAGETLNVEIRVLAVEFGPSEFEDIQTTIAPLLENVSVAELTENERNQDISFLSGETALERSTLSRFVMAHRLAAQSKLEPEFWYALFSAPVYLHLFAGFKSPDPAEQMKVVTGTLNTVSSADATNFVTRAIDANIINASFREKIKIWIRLFTDFVASRTIGTPEGERPVLVSELVRVAGLNATVSNQFVRIWQEHQGPLPELWQKMREQQQIPEKEIALLETSYQLSDLVGNNFQAAGVVRENYKVETPDQLKKLARLGDVEWKRFITAEVAAGRISIPEEMIGDRTETKAISYSLTVAEKFKEAFPTMAFLGDLDRALQSRERPAIGNAEKMQQFLNEHTAFDLLSTPADAYFAEHPGDAALKQDIKSVQRVFKLAPDFSAVNTLLKDNVHAAAQIYRMGKTSFIKKYETKPGFTPAIAKATYNKAAKTYAAVVTLVGELQAIESAGSVQALNDNEDAVNAFPNWQNLFGKADICECEHCRSVFSPGAYFADILMFLKNRTWGMLPPFNNVKDVLMERRPDLGYLEMSCENANTTLPYIDVVNEVLETVVAGGEDDVELAGLSALPADQAQAKTDISNAFAAAGISLAADFILSAITGKDEYMVRDTAVTYLLKKKATPNYFYEVTRQTKVSAAEARAWPQFVKPAAYKKLSSAVYPMLLPFDLFNEEVRLLLDKNGVKRWRLMEDLLGTAAPNNPTEEEIAAAYFNLAYKKGNAQPDEGSVLLMADEAGQFAYWGATGNAQLLSTLKEVDLFLQRTGLEYSDMLILFDQTFINPDGDIYIEHLDASCDVDQKEIKNLDAAKIDRIHRFLRLWKKLGWKMWEINLVIMNPAIGAGNIDEHFLVNLMYFMRLKEILGKVSVEELCSLFHTINTTTKFSKLHEPRTDSLYHTLFLNKLSSGGIDEAFAIEAVDVPVSAVFINDHLPVIQGGLKLKEKDLLSLTGLTKPSDDTPYTNGQLTLTNLSFLHRHALLARLLKYKMDDWAIVLKLLNKDLVLFNTPAEALETVNTIQQIKSSGFSLDELNYVLSADLSARAAMKEKDITKFLAELRKGLKSIVSEYDKNAVKYEFLQTLPPTAISTGMLQELLKDLLQKLSFSEERVGQLLQIFSGELLTELTVGSLPADFAPLADIGIEGFTYDATNKIMRFTGVMTAAQRNTLLTDASLAAITGDAGYQQAVDTLFNMPRMLMKFFDTEFISSLEHLPDTVSFSTQLDAALSIKIWYDAEQRALHFNGIMTAAERDAIAVLSAEAAYVAAVNDLFNQPAANATEWLSDADLAFPLRDLDTPANDNQNSNLKTAIDKLLDHLKITLSDTLVTDQFATLTSLRPATITRLFEAQLFLPDTSTVIDHFTNALPATDTTIDAADAQYARTYQLAYRAHRLALLITKLKLDLPELEWLLRMHNDTDALDINALPLVPAKPSHVQELLNTANIFRLHNRLSDIDLSILDIFDRLQAGGYNAAAFGADLNTLTEWPAADIETITTTLNLNYPADYLKAGTWQRIETIFSTLEKLGGSVATVKDLANATLSGTDSEALKQLLRARYDEETWLQLSTEVQDVLRERKRDGLVAYLLTQPMPANAPSGKWENTNDLYSYYLVDVEMASCQLTSRLVQGSGAVQLFVQRCFMGLEPQVKVDDTNDSAWKWWKWMKKYRVWEANRKIFLYPENWIEPELRIDKSPFFSDLENELLQNDVNRDTVEQAFLKYIEQLDGVARLEIAGFYHEDDGDKTYLHVFGRTRNAEPHTYFYRQWDYRRWSPWVKVDLDISEDYLMPVIINKRLYLFWPVFTEVSADDENKKVNVPDVSVQDQEVPQAKKKLKIQMAVSEFRNKKWSAKKISKDYIISWPYESAIDKSKFQFVPIDRTKKDGKFVIYCKGNAFAKFTNPYGHYLDMSMEGTFELLGCKGIPELLTGENINKYQPVAAVKETNFSFFREKENTGRQYDDFTLLFNGLFAGNNYLQNGGNYSSALLIGTPGIFKGVMPRQLSYFDKLFQDVCHNQQKENICPYGLWLPFFFEDKNRSFFVLPVHAPYTRREPVSTRYYYPELKKLFMSFENHYYQLIENLLTNLRDYLPSLTAAQRQQLESFLGNYFNATPPFTDDQIIDYYRIIYRQYAHFLLGIAAMNLSQFRRYHVTNFYHSYSCHFAKQIYTKGIDGLMNRDTQLLDTGFDFKKVYKPTFQVLDPVPDTEGNLPFYPREHVDFSPDGSYSQYNWELFYHAPLMIAMRLSQNQRFEEAMDWFHYIFNPLDSSSVPAPQKFWVTKPFFQTQDATYVQQRIENILRMLAGDTSIPGYTNQLKKELEQQVLDWRDHPFDPHIIAQFRTVAYQKTTILKYLDNLIAWGDQLFRQDSMESINEATQLYVLAAEILGPRPKKVPPRVKPPVESFNELEPTFDSFSNALVDVENLVPPLPPGDDADDDKAPIPDMLYFCIPLNEKLLEYWDVVADRLYKIRHCMNIEGVERQLALFEPPIDPGMLVKAAAAGLDISTVLADLNAPMPLYRFNIMMQKTIEVCAEVKSLGTALLSVLEKKNAEELGLLRQTHEIRVLEAVKAVKKSQLEEAKETLASLQRSKTTIETRRDYYRDIEKIIQGEQLNLDMQKSAHQHQQKAQSINIGASILGYIPNMSIGVSGFGGSPHLNAQWGTGNIISALQAQAGAETNLSNTASYEANRALTLAGYDRRYADWKLQEKVADKEIAQLDKQIVAAEIRVSIAEKEIDNHDLQIEQAKAVDDFMQDKYTNKQLYEWMITQTSQVYFQSYKLAYDLAKKAERCYRFELGLENSSFLQFGYWDSLKKGLMSGEKLFLDCKRMDAAYLDLNKREYELTKHISLARLNPEALLLLKKTGKCFVTLPEALFNLDYPGHYMRRIKSVSITIPCVTGPYTTISCSLRLVKSSVRKKSTLLSGKYERDPDASTENRFLDYYGVIQSIATSSGQNDNGLFELNFRDDRYLPFEGAGVISEWQLEMPAAFRQFDYDSISDVVLHMKYTAREGGKALGDQAIAEITETINMLFDEKGLYRMLSVKQDFPDAFHVLLNGPINPQTAQFELREQYFPYMFAGKTLAMTEVKVFLLPKDGQTITTGSLDLNINDELPAGAWAAFKQTDVQVATYELTGDPLIPWTVNAVNGGLNNDEIEDMLILIRYTIDN